MAHKIIIEAISADQQRYKTGAAQEPTLGDWLYDEEGNLQIKVTGIHADDPETFLIALHELVEVQLCKMRGITQKQVDDFDFAFKGDAEPGDAVDSPYRKEHRFACLLEHQMAHEMGLTGYGKVE